MTPGQTLEDRIVGAKITRVVTVDATKVEVHFEHRGTDDDAGVMVLPLTGIYFLDGGR